MMMYHKTVLMIQQQKLHEDTIRVESGSDDPDYLGRLGHFLVS